MIGKPLDLLGAAAAFIAEKTFGPVLTLIELGCTVADAVHEEWHRTDPVWAPDGEQALNDVEEEQECFEPDDVWWAQQRKTAPEWCSLLEAAEAEGEREAQQNPDGTWGMRSVRDGGRAEGIRVEAMIPIRDYDPAATQPETDLDDEELAFLRTVIRETVAEMLAPVPDPVSGLFTNSRLTMLLKEGLRLLAVEREQLETAQTDYYEERAPDPGVFETSPAAGAGVGVGPEGVRGSFPPEPPSSGYPDPALFDLDGYERGLADTVLIGRECFAASDGSVICWQGVNYTPQAERPSVDAAVEMFPQHTRASGDPSTIEKAHQKLRAAEAAYSSAYPSADAPNRECNGDCGSCQTRAGR